MISDLHFGNLAPDALERFRAFRQAVVEKKPDCVIQLGDFCHPEEDARKLMEEWNAIEAEKYHVLGNHDMDKGTKEDIQKFWGMNERHYHFDKNGWKFVVIDMNNLKDGNDYVPYGNANFYVDSAKRTWADPEQLEWLNTTLAESKLPVIVFTHQPIGNRPDSPQQQPLLKIISQHVSTPGRSKTRAVICGHEHQDWHREVDGVHHICINSASYLWKAGKPWPYEESLFSFMELTKDKLILTGRKTTWKRRPEGVHSDPAVTSRNIDCA